MMALLWLAPLLAAILSLPRWPWSQQWGFVPCAGLALLALAIFCLRASYVI